MDEPDEIKGLRGQDAETRAKRTNELVAYYQDVVNECSRIRKEALAELVAQGRTQLQLAALLGMTRARVGQLLATGTPTELAERALLGTGLFTSCPLETRAGHSSPPRLLAVLHSDCVTQLLLRSSSSVDFRVSSRNGGVSRPASQVTMRCASCTVP